MKLTSPVYPWTRLATHRRTILSASVAALLAGAAWSPYARAVFLAWDTNGPADGSGSATGTWGISSFFNSDLTGNGSTFQTTTTNVDDLIFSAGMNCTAGTVTISGAQAANSLTLDDDAPVTLTGGTSLTLGGGGGSASGVAVAAGVNAATSILTPILLGTSSTAFTVANRGGGLLSVSAITGAAPASGMQTVTFTNAGTGGIQAKGAIANNGALGKLAVEINNTGTGAVLLTGANTYSGGTAVTAGSVLAGARSLGTGPVNLLAGTTLAVSQTGGVGLAGQYFNIAPANSNNSNPNLNSLPVLQASLATTAPSQVLPTTSLNLGAAFPGYTAATTNIEAYFSGMINITTAGTYTFNTSSDDGSVLYIDGAVVVNNNAYQPLTTKTGSVALAVGLHNIALGFFQSTGEYGLSAQISGPGNTTMVDLSAANVQITPDLVIGSLTGAGNVKLDTGNLITGQDNTNQSFAGIISGIGAVQKWGTGTQTLAGTNTYSGATVVSAGTLAISAATHLGNGSATNSLVLNGGSLRSTGNSYDLGATRNVTLNAASTVQVDADTLTISGVVSGSGLLSKTGGGVLYLTGANTFGTNSAVTISAGTLRIDAESALGAATNDVFFGTAGTLEVSGTFTSSATKYFSVGTNTATVQVDGAHTFTVDAGAGGATSGFIGTGAGKVIKTGPGTLALAGDSSYNDTTGFRIDAGLLSLRGASPNVLGDNGTVGDITLNGGSFSVDTDTVLASVKMGLIVNAVGGSVSLNRATPGAGLTTVLNSRPAILNGNLLVVGGGNVNSGTAGLTLGTLTLGAPANVTIVKPANGGATLLTVGPVTNAGNRLTITGDGGLAQTGAISGAGGVTLDPTFTGTVTFNQANNYAGATLVQGGTLAITGSGYQTGAFTVGSGGTLAISAVGSQGGPLAGTPSITVNAGGLVLLTSGDALGYTGGKEALVINPGGLVANNGTGTRVTLANTVTMTAGTLGGSSLGDSQSGAFSWVSSTGLQATSDAMGQPALVSARTSLQTATKFNITRGPATLGNSPDAIISGVISTYAGVTGGLTKSGNGILALTASNTYTAPTSVESGTLLYAAGASAGSSSLFVHGSAAAPAAVRIEAGASVTIAGPISIGQVSADTGATLVLNGGNLASTGSSSYFTVGDNNVGSGGQASGTVTQTSGSLTLGTAATPINYVSIAAANVGDYSLSGGTITSYTQNGFNIGDRLGAVGTMTVSGSGLLNANTADGIFISKATSNTTTRGTLTINAGGVVNTSKITFGGAGAGSNVIGTLNLNGGLLSIGAGGLTETSGSVSSTTHLNGGTLKSAAAFSVAANMALLVDAGGAVLDTSGGNITINSPLLAGAPAGGELTKQGANSLVLPAINTYTGTTHVLGGTLEVRGSIAGSQAVEVASGGTLLFGGTGDRVGSTAAVSLGAGSTPGTGGILNTGGLNEGPAGGAAGASGPALGVLTLGAHSTIDFAAGTGSNLLFAGLLHESGDPVRILNWTGSLEADTGAAASDRLLFFGLPVFTSAQLAGIQFYNDSGTLIGAGAGQITFRGYTELVPISIPEPSTFTLGMAALLLLGRPPRRGLAKGWLPQTKKLPLNDSH